MSETIEPKGIIDMIEWYNQKGGKNEVSLFIHRLNSIVKDTITYIDLAGNRGNL